jgi:UDP-N-acetylglucosamine acyltransferase
MIHPHTYIHPNAKLATNVKVDPFTVIHQDVEIGEGTWIGSNVTIMEGARIGKNCRIFPGAVLGAIPQDRKFDGERTTVEIGDNCTIREFVTIHRGTSDRMKTVVGDNCWILAYSHIGHDCIIGNNCTISNNSQLAGHVVLGDWVGLGGVCAIHQFVHVGSHSLVRMCRHISRLPASHLAMPALIPLVSKDVVSQSRRSITFLISTASCITKG